MGFKELCNVWYGIQRHIIENAAQNEAKVVEIHEYTPLAKKMLNVYVQYARMMQPTNFIMSFQIKIISNKEQKNAILCDWTCIGCLVHHFSCKQHLIHK